MGARFFLPLFILCSLTLAADPVFLRDAPVRERFMNLDDQSSWTMRKGEGAVPLAVVPVGAKTVVSLSGGWVVLGPDLEYEPYSLDFLSKEEISGLSPCLKQGTPWVSSRNNAVLFLTSSPGKLAVLYLDTGVCFDQDVTLADVSHFTVTDRGFLYAQGRRTSTQAHWNKPIREDQPFLFFPSDLASAADGTPWACDSLQARPWRREGDFWKPLDLPQGVGRMTGIAPFPDSSGYLASGEGWVGAFNVDGTLLWSRATSLEGKPLPRDIRIRSGTDRVFLWSSQERRLWVWLWGEGALKGRVLPPTGEVLAEGVRQEISRFTALGSLPQALQVCGVGEELAQNWLIAQPFSVSWKQALQEFSQTKKSLRQRIVGNGQLTLDWSLPYGKPLADWTWEPDASLPTDVDWNVTAQPFWEGQGGAVKAFKMPLQTTRAPLPGVNQLAYGPLQLPSYLVLNLTPGEKKKLNTKNKKKAPDLTPPPLDLSGFSSWLMVKLPIPPQPYDLPVE